MGSLAVHAATIESAAAKSVRATEHDLDDNSAAKQQLSRG
jgi:hypothetical protein